MRSHELVVLTPEHVEIRLEPAGLGSRFAAVLIDGLAIVALAIAGSSLLALVLPAGWAHGAQFLLLLVVTWGYHVWFEVRRDGRSPGKALCGLRVVDGRGLPIGAQQSLVRNMLRALDYAPACYGLGALVCLIDPHHRRLGDLAADTVVVTDRAPPAFAAARLDAERRHNSLETPRIRRLLRHRIGLEEREFLLALCLRAPRLTEEARFDLMEQAGAWYRERLRIEDPHLSGANLVRGLTAALFREKVLDSARVPALR